MFQHLMIRLVAHVVPFFLECIAMYYEFCRDTIGLAIHPIRKAYHPNCCCAMIASPTSTVGHRKVGSSPYGSISQERMLAIRIGMRAGYVSSLVSHTSNSTRRLSVRVQTSGCGHVRM